MQSVVTWAEIEPVLREYRGARVWSEASSRCWYVPSPTGGTFSCEVALRTRWCTIRIDRWRTTDRMPLASAWMEAHLWPYVDAALERRGRRSDTGFLPSGRVYAVATPVDRCDVLGMLAVWLEKEMQWGLPADDQWPDCAPHDVVPGPMGNYNALRASPVAENIPRRIRKPPSRAATRPVSGT
jgi:hypothetical protein